MQAARAVGVVVNLDVIDKLGIVIVFWFPRGPIVSALLATLLTSFRSRTALQMEILSLRHQLGVLQRSVKRPKLKTADRLHLERMALQCIYRPSSAVIAWHRTGFRLFWTWKVRHGKPGRPLVPQEVRELIRTMSRETRYGSSAYSRRAFEAWDRHRRNQDHNSRKRPRA